MSIDEREWATIRTLVKEAKNWAQYPATQEIRGGGQAIVDVASFNRLRYASGYADLATAVSEIGATETTLVINEAEAVTSDLTIPATMSLIFQKGGIVAISNTKVLTINGPIQAGFYQIFSGLGHALFGLGVFDRYPVQWWGATADGTTNDLAAVNSTIGCVQDMQTLYFPKGRYFLDGALTTVTGRRVNILGDGVGSQIWQDADEDLFTYYIGGWESHGGLTIKHLSLASAATTVGKSLLYFKATHRMVLEDITMGGAYYGIYLHGSLCNTMRDIRSNINFGVAGHWKFATQSTNHDWIYMDEYDGVGPNANKVYNPILEFGTNGITHDPSGTGGGLTVLGGTIEGCSGWGVKIKDTGVPSILSGVHMEANGEDVILDTSWNVTLENVTAGTLALIAARNCCVRDSYIEDITLDAACKDNSLARIKYGWGGGGIKDYSAEQTTRIDQCNYQGKNDVGYGYSDRDGFNVMAVNGALERWHGTTPNPMRAFGGAGVVKSGPAGSYYATVTGAAATYTGLEITLPLKYTNQWITLDYMVHIVSGTSQAVVYNNDSAPLHVEADSYIEDTTGVLMRKQISFFPKSYAGTTSFSVAILAPDSSVIRVYDAKLYVSRPIVFGAKGFTDQDTTPSVYWPDHLTNIFTVTNTIGTDITTFDDGYEGQEIILMFTDGNTTILETDNIHLSAAFTSSADDTMRLIFDGTNWYEVMRSVN